MRDLFLYFHSMLEILKIVLGTVTVNKIKLKIGNTKRNPFTLIALQFKENYVAEWKARGDIGKFFLVVLPLTNLFLLSGVFSFLVILTLDFFLVRYILNK